MQNNRDRVHPHPLIVIVGPTATGKTELAIQFAERFDGEIICADSRTVYQGIDIGSAKPTSGERNRVPHWGLDLVRPDERFTVADFQAYALRKIEEITGRGRIAIMVGGSGLYIDSILYNYHLLPEPDKALHERLSVMTINELKSEIIARGYTLPADSLNPRRLMRVIETRGRIGSATDRQNAIRQNTLVIGMQVEIEEIENRIRRRVESMIDAGLLNEIRETSAEYGWEVQALQAPGYRALQNYIRGNTELEQAIEIYIKNNRALAKRQRTWFKRNKSIHWLTTEDKLAKAVDLATTFLDT